MKQKIQINRVTEERLYLFDYNDTERLELTVSESNRGGYEVDIVGESGSIRFVIARYPKRPPFRVIKRLAIEQIELRMENPA